MPASTSDKKTASRDEREENGQKSVRQDLRSALRHTGEIERLGLSQETCQYLGAGYYPAGEKSRSPMAGKLVFQVRGCVLDGEKITPHILSHVGVAPGENEAYREWSFYPGFEKEKGKAIYNIDLLTDDCAIRAAREDGFLVLLQDPLDAAKMVGAGSLNVVSTFIPSLAEAQVDLIEEAAKLLGIKKVLVWFHRGEGAVQEQAVELLRKRGISGMGFHWQATFHDRERGLRSIPDELTRAFDFSASQLTFVVEKFRQQEKWLRQKVEHERAR